MYNNQDMRSTRHYHKLYFQLATYISMDEVYFPMEVFSKKYAACNSIS